MAYQDLTLEQLEAKRYELMQEVEIARTALAECAAEYDKKARIAQLTDKFNGLTPEELELLKGMTPQSLSASSIDSQSQMGNL